jgi:hypothetical protein
MTQQEEDRVYTSVMAAIGVLMVVIFLLGACGFRMCNYAEREAEYYTVPGKYPAQ